MIYIAHRINTIAQLEGISPEYGVEIDLRDSGKRLILQHDPFSEGEDFESYIRHYRHRFIILNIKSEQVEHRALEIMRGAGVRDYFFLDSSFPMIRQLVMGGERQVAVRFSEYEPVEAVMALKGQVTWVWIDCFTKMPLTLDTYQLLKSNFKLCVVSPELQGRSPETIREYAETLRPYPVDAVCTKYIDLWRSKNSLRSYR